MRGYYTRKFTGMIGGVARADRPRGRLGANVRSTGAGPFARQPKHALLLVRIQNAASDRGRTNCQSRDQHSHHSVDARVGGALQNLAFWGARSSWWRIGPGNRSADRNVAQFIEPYRFG